MEKTSLLESLAIAASFFNQIIFSCSIVSLLATTSTLKFSAF